MTIEELRKRLQELDGSISELLNTVDAREGADSGILTAEESERFDELMAEQQRVQATLDRRVQFGESQETLASSPGRQTAPATPGAEPRITDVHDRREDDDMCGYAHEHEFALDVYAAATRLQQPSAHFQAYQEYPQIRQAAATTGHTAASGAASGVPVPPAMSRRVYQLMFPEDGLLARCDREPTSSNAVEKDRDETVPWSTSGVQARWTDAADVSAYTQDTAEPMDQDIVRIHDLVALVPAKQSLLADAPRLESKLTREAGMKFAWQAEEAVIYGTGVGKPMGYFNHASLVSVAKESGQSANTVVAANISKIWSRILVRPGSMPVWLVNQDTYPELIGMTLGDHVIFQPADRGFQQAPGGFLLGLPIVPTQHAKTVGDKGDIQLVDLSGYYLAERTGGVEAARSMHLWFDQGMEAFRWTMRLGGQPHLSAAVTPANGSNTLSHFVTLDARA